MGEGKPPEVSRGSPLARPGLGSQGSPVPNAHSAGRWGGGLLLPRQAASRGGRFRTRLRKPSWQWGGWGQAPHGSDPRGTSWASGGSFGAGLRPSSAHRLQQRTGSLSPPPPSSFSASSPCRRERTLKATHFVSQPLAVAQICARRRAHLAPGPAPPSNLDAAPWFPVPDTPCARHFVETEKTSPEERRGGRLASRNPCPRPVSLLHHLGLPLPRPTLPGPRAPRFLSPGPGRPRLQFLQPASPLSFPVPTPHI